MNDSDPIEEWPIYNCHMHTFTKQHSPKHFWVWVLADPDTGKINFRKIGLALLYLVIYLGLLALFTWGALRLSGRSDPWSMLGYSLLLLLESVMVFLLASSILILLALGGLLLLNWILDAVLGWRSRDQPRQKRGALVKMKERVDSGQKRIMRSKLLFDVLVRILPSSNDIFERTARFLKIAEQPTQEQVFLQVQQQYPVEDKVKTRFVVLPMNMEHMHLGSVPISIDDQHKELLSLAECYQPQIIPFYAADPRDPRIVEKVKENLVRGKFEGIKIYPNLGYPADVEKLMEIYKLCIKGNFPVVTHCSPGGIWQWGLPRETRRAYSEPLLYKRILDTPGYRDLKIDLAHFGGAEEWNRHLKGRSEPGEKPAWVRTIFEMIADGEYPNLYTDISYTAFTPKLEGLFIDLIDYLKVMLTNPRVRKRVLFGSDYYMVERESVSEKEASILLRSRLGEDLYRQIAYTNPREFLCIPA
jgi:uncharacterized protein